MDQGARVSLKRDWALSRHFVTNVVFSDIENLIDE